MLMRNASGFRLPPTAADIFSFDGGGDDRPPPLLPPREIDLPFLLGSKPRNRVASEEQVCFNTSNFDF